MNVYYNEIDAYCAQWLSNLMDADLIPRGDIDIRSIEDVRPDELRGYTQCHFFAGLGGWAYALQLSGWGTRPVWTGSCPCQPFSAAGKGAGFADKRHLWPAWQHLIAQCRPSVIFGEQVASKDADAWIDLVHADLEGMGYAFGCVPLPAAGVRAPHIRDRSYWVADPNGRNASAERQQRRWEQRQQPQDGGVVPLADPRRCNACDGLCTTYCDDEFDSGLAYSNSGKCDGRTVMRGNELNGTNAGWAQGFGGASACGEDGRLADADGHGCSARSLAAATAGYGCSARAASGADRHEPAGPANGHWGVADWLACTDGKWRPVSASPQPVVDGLPISLGLLRASVIEEIEEEVNAWAMETGIGRGEALRDLWRSAHEAAPRVWPAGGIPGLHEAPFLLAFLRQLAQQGWGIAECLSVPRQEVPQGRMRVLWSDIGASRAPCELRLEGQPAREYPDALRVLSSILARHAHQAWEVAHSAYAETCFPLGTGLHGRVGRLRAYGNAIVPQAAAEFIETYCEARGLTADQQAVA